MQPETLEQMAMTAVIKSGYWASEDVPHELHHRLVRLEDDICERMTGSGYSYFNPDFLKEYDMNWFRGCWTFVLRHGSAYNFAEENVEIRDGRDTFLSVDWAELFGVEGTPADIFGFRVKKFDIDVNGRKVTFYGEIPSAMRYGEESTRFRTVFNFSQMGYTLMIETSQLDHETDLFITIMERYLEQPSALYFPMVDRLL